MRLEIPFRQDWETSSDLSYAQVCEILSQSFTYLDRGAQCYVFASQDGEYVVKIFRFDRALISKKRKKDSPMQKIESLFTACVLASEKAREETGILYLHLNRTKNQFPTFYAKGPLGQTISIPIDYYRFAIQKKVVPFGDSLRDAYHSKSPDAMKKRIDSFLDILHSRVEKGIRNSDPSVGRNFGFLGERAFEIDFGNYSLNGSSKEKEIAHYTKRLRLWLSENAPEWVSYLDERGFRDR